MFKSQISPQYNALLIDGILYSSHELQLDAIKTDNFTRCLKILKRLYRLSDDQCFDKIVELREQEGELIVLWHDTLTFVSSYIIFEKVWWKIAGSAVHHYARDTPSLKFRVGCNGK